MSARQPAHGRVKRSIADFALSLAVIFAMLALLVGVPYALALGFGRPFSGDGPSMLTRPMSIRILVGSPPGGPSDITTRTFARRSRVSPRTG